MNTAWSIEFIRIFSLILSTLLLGAVSGYWLFSVVLHSGLYIGWNLYQLKTFERWIRKGAPKNSAPDTTGVWQLTVQHIYRSQKSNKDRKKQLTKVATHYHAIMSALPDATIILSKNREIEWSNKRAEKLLGIDSQKDIGQRFDNIIRDVELNKLFSSDEEESVLEMTSPIDSQTRLSVFRKHYGDDKTLLVVSDISQRLAVQKLRKAFIANASHELRTPLTVISGYLEILETEEELPPAIGKVIKSASQQALRMEQILNDLLVLSKLEESRYSVSSGEVINVAMLLNRLVADFKVTHNATGNDFELTVDSTLNLKVIERDFYSLCQNLLSNAIKYSKEKSTIKICWSLSDDGQACLAITDFGEGIAREHLSRLTERFYRVHIERSQKVVGTGLGLSIVKHILDNFGGYLDVQSEQGKGSTFTACFPRSRVLFSDASKKH